MSQAEDHPHEHGSGTIHVEANWKRSLPPKVLAEFPAKGVTADLIPVALYTWRPSAVLQQLPPGFTVALGCVRSPEDGLRRFYPATGFDWFIGEAFLGGLALLERT